MPGGTGTGDAMPHGGAERSAGQIVLGRLAGAVGIVRAQHGEWAGRERRAPTGTKAANSVCSATA